MRAAISVEISGVKAAGAALAPPEVHDIAFVASAAKFSGATAARPKVSALAAGDAVTLEGYYEIPAPRSASGARTGFDCMATRCWPRLVVDRSIGLRSP